MRKSSRVGLSVFHSGANDLPIAFIVLESSERLMYTHYRDIGHQGLCCREQYGVSEDAFIGVAAA